MLDAFTPRNARPLRWGMIGCGSVTEVKSGPAYRQTPGFTLQAVVSRTRAKAEDYAQRHGVPEVYGDALKLIHAPSIDAVYVATPPDSHEVYALEVARAGKICCIENRWPPALERALPSVTLLGSVAYPFLSPTIAARYPVSSGSKVGWRAAR